jgi:diacylglycerol kinase family enzyme
MNSYNRKQLSRLYRNAFLIYNPNAGGLVRERGHRIARAAALLRSLGHVVTELPTEGANHATTLAREALARGADCVLAAGGDGTINEALNGMIGSEVPLGILPAGTANVLACEMRLGRGIREACRRLASLEPRRIAAGRFEPAAGEPRYFLLMAGAGFDADVVRRVQPGVKRRLGKAAYWIAGMSRIGARLPQMSVRLNGREIETGFALASRVRNYGGDLEIAREVSLLDRDFEFAAFKGRSTWPYAFYMSGVVFGALSKLPGVTVTRTDALELAPSNGRPVYVQLDGELAGTLPARITAVPEAVTLLTPPELPRRYAG